jgi:hypothetical protein
MSHVGSVSPAVIDQFMAWVDAAAGDAGRSFFSYLIVREEEGVALVKGALIMNSVGDLFPYCPGSLTFEKFTAGYLEIQGGKEAILTFVSNLLTGAIEVDEHKISMVQGHGYALTALKIDDPEGTLPNSAARQSRSTLIGAMHGQSLGPAVDWLLRSAKEFLATFTERHPEVFADFKEWFSQNSLSIPNRELDDIEPLAVVTYLKRRLREIPSGRDHAADYHRISMSILELVFYPDVVSPKKEREIHQGRKRVDFTMENAASTGFFSRLPAIHRIPSSFIFIECKNYSTDIATGIPQTP